MAEAAEAAIMEAAATAADIDRAMLDLEIRFADSETAIDYDCSISRSVSRT